MVKLFSNIHKYHFDNKYHFMFNLKDILIIRSFSPLLPDLYNSIIAEFPDCNIDILQVKGASSIKFDKIKNVYETISDNGFLLRYIPEHYKIFQDKKYDIVFVLYGTPRGLARYFNVDIYAYFTPARYRAGFDINNHYKVISKRVLIFKLLEYISSHIVFFINIIATVLMFIYAIILIMLLSPLGRFRKVFCKKSL